MPSQRTKSKPIATELEVEQGSDSWLEARLPLITASEFVNVLAKNLGKTEAAARKNYRAEKVIARMTGKQPDRFRSRAMEWGNDTEALAAMEYSLATGNTVREAGIFVHNELPIGDSPDRIVGDDGTVEIKCLNTANHIEVLKAGTMPKKHYPQVQGHIWMTGRKWCDFVSFDPDMPLSAQLFIERIHRDDEYINNVLIPELIRFNDEIEADIAFLNNYGNAKEAAV